MSDVDYEPYPAENIPSTPYQPVLGDGFSGNQPPWNRFALWSFFLPIGLFLLSYIFGQVIAATYGFTTGLVVTFVSTMAGSVVEIAVEIVGLVLGHKSLGAARRYMRGRGFGVAGLVLNYLSLIWTLISAVVVISAYLVIVHNGMTF